MTANRLPLQTSHVSAKQDRIEVFEQGLVTQSETCPVEHSLFAPMHYEPNYAYPLFVWLHGDRMNECQLQRVMPLISMRNYVAVSGRGIHPAADSDTRFCWGSTDSDAESDIACAERIVFDCIDAAQERFNVASHRIFLAGFQSGGSVALQIGLRFPRQFAGVLSVGGRFPCDGQPLASLRDVRQLPFFLAQGEESARHLIEQTCQEMKLFHAAGLDVTLRQYPGGDSLPPEALHDMDVWAMGIVTGRG